MENMNVARIIARLQNRNLYTIGNNRAAGADVNGAGTGFAASGQTTAQSLIHEIQLQNLTQTQLKMNYLAGQERSAYIKTLLNLPQSLMELMLNLQKSRMGTESVIKDLKLLQIFDEATQIQQLINQAVPNKPVPQAQMTQNTPMAMLFSGLLQLNDVATLIQANSRVAMTQLIAAMASASKQGLDNSQILETMNLLNSCVAMLEDKTPQSTLKSLMLLYLPWLPLPSGVGFELEVGAPPAEHESSDSVITVLIQTKNYGNVKGSLTLTTQNSVDVLILCTEEFPKEVLYKRLQEEMKNNSVQTNIDIEVMITKQGDLEENQAKVNLSATNEMNPYLLLMAHSFIRNTIVIDNSYTVNVKSSD